MTNIILPMVGVALFLASCGIMQYGSEESFKKGLDKYKNQSIDKVVDDYSHADSVSQAPNGNRLFIYSNSSTSRSAVKCKTNNQGEERCTGGDVSTSWCKIYFEVNSDNIVIDYSYKGNNCRSCELKDILLCY